MSFRLKDDILCSLNLLSAPSSMLPWLVTPSKNLCLQAMWRRDPGKDYYILITGLGPRTADTAGGSLGSGFHMS